MDGCRTSPISDVPQRACIPSDPACWLHDEKTQAIRCATGSPLRRLLQTPPQEDTMSENADDSFRMMQLHERCAAMDRVPSVEMQSMETLRSPPCRARKPAGR